MIDEIRRRLAEPSDLVARLGLDEKARRQSSGVMICCPWHFDKSPSCSVSRGKDRTIRVHCFGCGQSGDAISLVAVAHNLDPKTRFRDVLGAAAAIAGVDLDKGYTRIALPQRTRSTTEPARRPPDARDVWERATPVYDDLRIRRELTDRAIDPAVVTDRDLARVLQPPLPRWAYMGGRSWCSLGNRLAVPMFDAHGDLVSIHARRLIGDGAAPKGLSPTGYQVGGLVFVDPLGQLVLSGAEQLGERDVFVNEGAPDFLTLAVHFADDESSPMVLGVISGSWSSEVAARIPDKARVYVRAHSDAAGQKYLNNIAASLQDRCSVFGKIVRQEPVG